MNIVDYDVALEVASHEAVIRQAYKDSVGKWTWSVGLTSATGHDVTRYIDNPVSLQRCMDVYVWALRNYAKQVDEAFDMVNLSKAQYAAAVSFHWNTGSIRTATWVKYFKAGKIDAAKRSFMTWTKQSSLIGRRQAECDLFFDGKWSNDGTMTEYTRVTASHEPSWSSAKRIDVKKELRLAFGAVVKDDHKSFTCKPDPDIKVEVPTLSPPKVIEPIKEHWFSRFLGNILRRG